MSLHHVQLFAISPWNSLGQNPGVGSLSLLQGIFPTQESYPGLPFCRRNILFGHFFFFKSVQHWHAVVVLIYCHRSLTPVSFKPSLAISTCWLTTCLTIFFNCTHQSKAIYKQLQLTEPQKYVSVIGVEREKLLLISTIESYGTNYSAAVLFFFLF